MSEKTKKSSVKTENKKADLIKETKEFVKGEQLKNVSLTADEKEQIKKCFEEAKQPISLTDADFKLGEQELDIRGLSKENQMQMLFRLLATAVSYQRVNAQSFFDIIRVLFVILKKLGVDDISLELENVLNEIKADVKTTTKA